MSARGFPNATFHDLLILFSRVVPSFVMGNVCTKDGSSSNDTSNANVSKERSSRLDFINQPITSQPQGTSSQQQPITQQPQASTSHGGVPQSLLPQLLATLAQIGLSNKSKQEPELNVSKAQDVKAETKKEQADEKSKDAANEKSQPAATPSSSAAPDPSSVAVSSSPSLPYEEKYKIVDELTSKFNVSNDDLVKISDLLMKEFEKGLSKETNKDAKVKMLPTFVRDVPDGTEAGHFLALDLGGTNFRVLLINLDINSDAQPDALKFEISRELMEGPGKDLFDFIAGSIEEFISKNHPGLQLAGNEKIPLGFTFSFPCRQVGLSHATLVRWTKGFKCSGVEGKDVVDLLREAISRRKNLPVEVVAILNDTTGTLMSCSHRNNDCRAGVIIGTGTNACYMEPLENVTTWTGDTKEPKQVIINTEWGAFGDDGILDFIRTHFDEQLDGESLNKGRQTFEKMISGHYLGEIVRRIMIELVNKNILFNGQSSEKLQTMNIINAKFLSKVEDDPYKSYTETRSSINKLDITTVSDEDGELVKLICQRVSTRAAYLAGAAISTIIKRMKRTKTLVGVDGSVYKFHPTFRYLVRRKIFELVPREHKFELMLSEDGSGVGAAVVAAVAQRQTQMGIPRSPAPPSSPNSSAGSQKSRKERKKTVIPD